ncbi:MAG: VCBS repeat-containing protein [Saprospiraceae bacterium]|nr:VCBS repeat-containing protein [Saprospiraceae bacterium]
MDLFHQNPGAKISILFSIAVAICFFGFSACKGGAGNSEGDAEQGDGQQKMIQMVAEIAKKINTPRNRYAAEAKLALYDSLATVVKNPGEKITLILKKSIVLLEYGDEAGAIAHLEQVLKVVGQNPKARALTLYWLGTAYLRLGERNNCVSGHTADACIMPLQASGIHQDKTGSRKAIVMFETFLKEAPDDKNYLDAVWLLNICYMTLGEYPQKVPKQWLIPDLNAPDYPMNPFVDIATDLKIMTNDRAGGSIVEDFDNDGYLDLVISAWDIGTEAMRYYKNNGDGTFTDRSVQSGLSVFKGGLNIQQTDYNNDGFLDIWVLRGAWQGIGGPFGEQPNSLLRNNGNGSFTDVTIETGLLSLCPTQVAAWNDFNNDGWIDVFVGNESVPGDKAFACEMYLNNGNGTFKNVAAECGVDVKMFVKGVGAGDYDNDGWPDLFLSTLNGEKVLLRNKGVQGGKLMFENATEKAGFGKESYRSFASFFFDYDNDGWLDVFVCNYEFEQTLSYYAAKEGLKPSRDGAGKPYIYHNNRNGTFTNVTPSMGINKTTFAMSGNFGDFNNDGFLDMYLGTGNPNFQSIIPNKLFMNLGGKKFADATSSSRTGNLQKGHGVSIADIDNDGDQDIHIEMGGAYRGDIYPNALYMNPGQNNNNWIYLKLEGTKSNRASIGAKITVKFRENGKQRMVYRELNSGGSFGSSPLRREIGIGQATLIDEISITWPTSGITQVVKNVQPNQLLKIKEGQEGFEVAAVNKMTFRRADGSIPMCAPAN